MLIRDLDGSKTVSGRELGGKRTALGIWGTEMAPEEGLRSGLFSLSLHLEMNTNQRKLW